MNQDLEKIRKKHNLLLILLHGSQVTGNVHKKSDIDIAVIPEGPFYLLELQADLTRNLKSDRVDITNLSHANPLLSFAVARKSKLLSGRKNDYNEFIRRSFHKYSDYQPYLKMEAEFVKNRINQYANN